MGSIKFILFLKYNVREFIFVYNSHHDMRVKIIICKNSSYILQR